MSIEKMTIDEQVAYLMQGAEYGDDQVKEAMAAELKERLIEAKKEGRALKVYCGYDPTAPDLHLGHTVTMRKLRQFQELGHEVTFLIGDYTSLVGDPSERDSLRPRLTNEQIKANAKTYSDQAFKILDREKTSIRYNSEWLSKLTFADVIQISSNFTVQQFLTRDNFAKRYRDNDAVYLHEFFYAWMQGYDAFMLDADVQVGGTDQLFNIITAARKLMTALGKKPNIGITMGILPGTDGEVRMSKSLGNYIPISGDPTDMYGKLMSIPDKAMGVFSRLVTRWTPAEISQFEEDIASGKCHPKDAKMALAKEIVTIYHGPDQADKAQADFIRVFQEQGQPEEMDQYQLKDGQTVLDVLVDAGLTDSRSQARRLINQNAVKLDEEKLTDPHQAFPGKGVLQVGKRHFIRII
ncbi:MAG TPA: tyrosine--tRNA ligase [Chloroflexi bacterium]|nr:MAG: tyrosine--tRNA ligase [Chloroflexota bacterium]HDD55883.1 tyrosine--tRNA ligase [Chloroflexota bacterium]